MQVLEMEKHRVDLSKRGCTPATYYNGRWSCEYGEGMSAVAHNYNTKRGGYLKLYDIYNKGVYECTFDTKKVAMEYLKCRVKGIKMQKGESNVLKDLTKAVDEVAAKMYDDIVEFLKQHNGLVRTDNSSRREMGLSLCDNIYTISMDGDDEPNTEKRVLAVALIGEDQVAVLPDLSNKETILCMSDQEILDCDNWEWINNGYVHRIATLYSICENIEQYV